MSENENRVHLKIRSKDFEIDGKIYQYESEELNEPELLDKTDIYIKAGIIFIEVVSKIRELRMLGRTFEFYPLWNVPALGPNYQILRFVQGMVCSRLLQNGIKLEFLLNVE